jgi:hypothetical protein
VGERRKKAQRHGPQAPHHRPEARPANARLIPTREEGCIRKLLRGDVRKSNKSG